MRLAFSFILLALLSGCAAPGVECCVEWNVGGDDPAFFAALAGVAGVHETRDPGWGVRDARLDTLWGEYALTAVNAMGGVELAGRSPERVRLSAGAAPHEDPAKLRANVTAFLHETILADASEVDALADALLANATPVYDDSFPFQEGTTPPTLEPRLAYRHYFLDIPHAPRGQALFDERTSGQSSSGNESFGRDQGIVEAGEWTFLFSFPMRRIELSDAAVDLRLAVNGHGGLVGHARFHEPLSERDARATIERALETRGATDVDARAWMFGGAR